MEEAAEAERRTMSSLAVLVLEDWLTDRGYLPKPGSRGAKRRGAT
jgi:hypothetical protein